MFIGGSDKQATGSVRRSGSHAVPYYAQPVRSSERSRAGVPLSIYKQITPKGRKPLTNREGRSRGEVPTKISFWKQFVRKTKSLLGLERSKCRLVFNQNSVTNKNRMCPGLAVGNGVLMRWSVFSRVWWQNNQVCIIG